MFIFRNDRNRHNNPKLTKAISILSIVLCLFIAVDFFLDNLLNPSYNVDGRPGFFISRESEIKDAETQIFYCMDQYGSLMRSVFSFSNNAPDSISTDEAKYISEYLTFADSVLPDTHDITGVAVCCAFVSNPGRVSFLPFFRSRLISASKVSIASVQSVIDWLDEWIICHGIPDSYYALSALHSSMKAYLYKLSEYPSACVLSSYKRSFRYCDTDWDSRSEYTWRTPTAFSGSFPDYDSYFENLRDQIEWSYNILLETESAVLSLGGAA